MNDYRIQIAENHVIQLNPYQLIDKGTHAKNGMKARSLGANRPRSSARFTAHTTRFSFFRRLFSIFLQQDNLRQLANLANSFRTVTMASTAVYASL